MKNILNFIVFILVAGSIFFGYKYLKNDSFPGREHGKTYAVVIGISDYLNGGDTQTDKNAQFNDLRFCDDDARMFYDFLTMPEGGSVSKENIALLIDNQASKANIMQQLDVTFAKSGPEDRVIFYFAGHGANGLFTTYDTDMRNENSNLLHKEVKEAFRKCHAKTRLCFADACMSGSIKNTEMKRSAAPYQNIPVRSFEDSESGLVVLMAARSYQYAGENKDISHGYFTKFLVDGLLGKADDNHDEVVTIKETYDYLFRNLASLPKKNAEDKGQIPVLFGKYDPKMPVSVLKSA